MSNRDEGMFAPRGGGSEPEFSSELAVDIVAELYPLLLENCTDEDDDVDTRAVLETLAGLTGAFMADYADQFGAEKTAAAWEEMTQLALAVYQQQSEALADDSDEDE